MRNLPASVRQRLLDRARREGRPFQELLQFYAMERFLYRLSQSALADRFILKGALMLQVWEAPQSRPTMDIDLLGKTDNNPEALQARIREVLQAPAFDDGMVFDGDSLQTEGITEEADYQGVRIRFQASLHSARVRLQLDVGFGDVVLPPPEQLAYPALLDFPAPTLWCYSRESAIAEKFQAMVALGELNSRMKDFYDIWLLARQFDFSLPSLAGAITATFEQRDTALPRPPIFSEEFATDKQPQWRAFVRRLRDDQNELDFKNVWQYWNSFWAQACRQPSGNPSIGRRAAPGVPWSSMMNEVETRAELIDPALRAAGWGLAGASRVRREVISPGVCRAVPKGTCS